MSIIDHEINRIDIKRFKDMLRRIDNDVSLEKRSDMFWREYCYNMGKVVSVLLKEASK